MSFIPHSNRSFRESIEEQRRRENKRFIALILKMAVVLILILGITAVCFYIIIKRNHKSLSIKKQNVSIQAPNIDYRVIPKYTGKVFCEINGNEPYFSLGSIETDEDFELYSELDNLGRCGTAFANLSVKLMPTEERGEIGMIKPSGWHTVKYPGIIEDLYLYNRCHLIAFSLAGENANELNLITGTRYFNVEGMLPFENQVRFYIERTGNHVLYRVTPLYKDDDLVALGVLMEALSVEDQGSGIRFNVFVYNVQPGIRIDYADGSSEVE